MISKELNLYFNKVKAVLDPGEQRAEDGADAHMEAPQEATSTAAGGVDPAQAADTRAVLASLRTNAGLQPLAPYLAHLIAQGVADHMEDPLRLSLLLRCSPFLVLVPHYGGFQSTVVQVYHWPGIMPPLLCFITQALMGTQLNVQ